MQARNAKVHDIGTGARPASDSALLAGYVVTVTIPLLSISNDLLAIGDEWTELRISDQRATARAHTGDPLAWPRRQ